MKYISNESKGHLLCEPRQPKYYLSSPHFGFRHVDRGIRAHSLYERSVNVAAIPNQKELRRMREREDYLGYIKFNVWILDAPLLSGHAYTNSYIYIHPRSRSAMTFRALFCIQICCIYFNLDIVYLSE